MQFLYALMQLQAVESALSHRMHDATSQSCIAETVAALTLYHCSLWAYRVAELIAIGMDLSKTRYGAGFDAALAASDAEVNDELAQADWPKDAVGQAHKEPPRA